MTHESSWETRRTGCAVHPRTGCNTLLDSTTGITRRAVTSTPSASTATAGNPDRATPRANCHKQFRHDRQHGHHAGQGRAHHDYGQLRADQHPLALKEDPRLHLTTPPTACTHRTSEYPVPTTS
jgi:hypothetical protein